MGIHPFSFDINLTGDWRSQFDRRLERRLSAMDGYYADAGAFAEASRNDPVCYEVYEMLRPEHSGELLHGLSVVHAGRVGDEFYMTKGHYHSERLTAEIYLGVRGRGLLLMEDETGEWAAEEIVPGRVVYVAPGWAHRSVNLHPSETLITFFAYPGHSGHDYATIQETGFCKLVLADGDSWRLADNPRRTAAGREAAIR
jgi:glucose-6-phosphate isomerase